MLRQLQQTIAIFATINYAGLIDRTKISAYISGHALNNVLTGKNQRGPHLWH
jgi:hypothetical protein